LIAPRFSSLEISEIQEALTEAENAFEAVKG
jgi:hypothetical protein